MKRTPIHLRSGRRHRIGALTAELAIVLPVLFLFIMASIEFSRAFVVLHTAENAAYEGARVGIVPGATAQEVTDMANGVLDAVGVSKSNIVVEPSVIKNDTPEVTVKVVVPMNKNGYLAPLFLKKKKIIKKITLTREAYGQTSVP